MGSAFTPVHPRRVSPMPTNINVKPGTIGQGVGGSGINRRSTARTKRTRQASTLHTMMIVDEVDEEKTADTVPDHLSTSASEAEESSAAGSNTSDGSQAPPLLDFIGNTCMASAWFTSCFPCAVVDINDSDDYVVDKLSRESAMNVMYGTKKNSANTNAGAGAEGNNSFSVTPEKRDAEQQLGGGQDNVMYVSLPEEDLSVPSAPIHAVPSVIQEESSEDDDEDEEAVMADISLDEPSQQNKLGLVVRVTPTRQDSGIVDDSTQPTTSAAADVPDEKPISSPPKKKRFGMKKLFSRKKV